MLFLNLAQCRMSVVQQWYVFLYHSTGIIRNDTVIGDPLFTVPIDSDDQERNLCFEVHGRRDTDFNLISDKCVSVNAHYAAAGDLNIISSIGVRAEGDDGVCTNIRVDLEGCTISAGTGGGLTEVGAFSVAGVSARKTRRDRVRISVPNCDNVNLVLWVICERRPNNLDMIRFQIARGVNLASTSHGLLGKFKKLVKCMAATSVGENAYDY